MKRQVDYNKIATNISKYSFAFDLTVDESYENFSKTYPEIYNKLNQIFEDDNSTPFFISDTESADSLLVQVVYRIEENYEKSKMGFRTSRVVDGEFYFQDFNYDFKKDIFKFTNTLEEYISIDDVKTLFGNKSIVGSGNIDLYRHRIHYYQDNVVIDFEVISSSNLKVDSLTDLKTLCKNDALVMASGKYTLNSTDHIITAIMVTSSAVFGIYDGASTNRVGLTTNQFTDTITTI